MAKVTLQKITKLVKEDGFKLSLELIEEFRILIILLNDLSGGVIKLGSVCNISRMKKFHDFEVSIVFLFKYSFI